MLTLGWDESFSEITFLFTNYGMRLRWLVQTLKTLNVYFRQENHIWIYFFKSLKYFICTYIQNPKEASTEYRKKKKSRNFIMLKIIPIWWKSYFPEEMRRKKIIPTSSKHLISTYLEFFCLFVLNCLLQ